MTLHVTVVTEMLEDEAESIRLVLGDQIEKIEVVGVRVLIKPKAWNGRWLRLDGSEYDQRPLKVAVLGDTLEPTGDWPGQLRYGQDLHPILNVPWSCTRGTYEYHAYPGHAAETWDQFRATIRMRHLVAHILRKAGGH